MEALRWILLLAGLVFLAALAAWEQHRPRQARRDGAGRSERSEPEIGAMDPTGQTGPMAPMAGDAAGIGRGNLCRSQPRQRPHAGRAATAHRSAAAGAARAERGCGRRRNADREFSDQHR